MAYQTVRALTPIRHNGILRVPGVTTGENAQDFVVDDVRAGLMIGAGQVTAVGSASAPTLVLPVKGLYKLVRDGLVVGLQDETGNVLTLGGSSQASSSAWTTAWDMSGAKDLGEYSITGALALTSVEASSVPGGYTQAVLIANGANIPTFDGVAVNEWVNTAGSRNLVQLCRAGSSKFWAVGSRLGTALSALSVPVIGTAPVITVATAGQPLTWSAAAATGNPAPTLTYEVLIGGSVVASGATSGSYTPTASGVTVTVRATATNSQGSVQATSAGVVIAAAATAPGAPTGLTLGAATNNAQPLTWAAPASNGGAALTDYVVQFAVAGSGSWTTFADGTGTSTSATVTGLSPSTSYDYRIAAVNSVGSGAYGSTATGSTAAAATVPGAPTGLTLGTPTTTTQPMTWAAPASNGGAAITDYVVQFAVAGSGSWTTFADGVSTSASATVSGLTAGTNYDYRVAAVNSVGTGANSATATGATTSAVTTTIARLLPKTAALTESGDGSAGWNYIGTQLDTGFGGNSSGATALKIAAGTDGWFQYTRNGTGNNAPFIGLKTSSATGGFSTSLYGVYSPGIEYKTTTGGTGAGAPTVSVAPAVGQIIRIGREGTTVVAKASNDGGSTFTTFKTWTGVSSADLYALVILPDTTVTADNIRGSGVV